MSRMINSMTRYIDEKSVAVRARQLRSELERTRHQPLAAVIVEGRSDQITYMSVLDTSKCYPVFGYNKETVIKAVRFLVDDGFKGVIGVVDADFDNLNGGSVAWLNLIVSDTHDLETMVLESSAFDKFLLFLLPSDKLHYCEPFAGKVRDHMIQLGKPIGYLRWLSDLENLSLDFNDMHFPKFIDGTRLVLDLEKMVDLVISRSGSCRVPRDEVLASLKTLVDVSHNPWDVCQGHDLISILAIVLPRCLETYWPRTAGERRVFEENVEPEIKPRSIEKSLIKCYGKEHFQATKTYKAMKDWEVQCPPYTILSAAVASS
jgi:hypothetical protein